MKTLLVKSISWSLFMNTAEIVVSFFIRKMLLIFQEAHCLFNNNLYHIPNIIESFIMPTHFTVWFTTFTAKTTSFWCVIFPFSPAKIKQSTGKLFNNLTNEYITSCNLIYLALLVAINYFYSTYYPLLYVIINNPCFMV